MHCKASTNDDDIIVSESLLLSLFCLCAYCLSRELYGKHFQIAVLYYLNHDNLMMCDTGYRCLNFQGHVKDRVTIFNGVKCLNCAQ